MLTTTVKDDEGMKERRDEEREPASRHLPFLQGDGEEAETCESDHMLIQSIY